MENMNPTLHFILFLRRFLEKGSTANQSVGEYLKLYPHGALSANLKKWMFLKTQRLDAANLIQNLASPYQRHLFLLLERSFAGEPILNQVLMLESETLEAIHSEIQKKVAVLPIIMLFPLMLFQLPALAGVILWPFLENLFHSLQ